MGAKFPKQYLWINADLDINSVLTDLNGVSARVITRVPADDYSFIYGAVSTVLGMILPFTGLPNAEAGFFMVPIGIILWAVHILSLEKDRPAGTIPGKTYYKYEVKFLR